jgi:hypothetical protein
MQGVETRGHMDSRTGQWRPKGLRYAGLVMTALLVAGCGGANKSTAPTTVAANAGPSTTTRAPVESTATVTSVVASTSPVRVAPASPTDAVNGFLAAEKAGDCPTAFADLATAARASAGGPATACAALHKDPVVSFVPSTLIHESPTGAIVQVQVTCGTGGSQFDIVDVAEPSELLVDAFASAEDQGNEGEVCGMLYGLGPTK